MKSLGRFWDALRQVLGEGDYRRHCAHLRERRPEAQPPTPAEYYLRRLEDRYSRPNRCC